MNIVHAEKYFEKVREKYPDLSYKQIEKIINHGLRTFYGYSYLGADILVKSGKFSAYFGKWYNNDNVFRRYKLLKLRVKARILYKLKNKIYNGKYYFGMTKEEYEEKYLPLLKNKIRRKTLHFEHKCLYLCLDEARAFNGNYLFEVDIPEKEGFIKWINNDDIKNFRLIEIKNKDKRWEPVSKGSKNEKKYNKRMKRRA